MKVRDSGYLEKSVRELKRIEKEIEDMKNRLSFIIKLLEGKLEWRKKKE